MKKILLFLSFGLMIGCSEFEKTTNEKSVRSENSYSSQSVGINQLFTSYGY